MTDLSTLLARIGWTTGELARRLDISPSTARSWISGRRGTPLSVLAWLESVADLVETADALPASWTDLRTEAD